MSLSPNVLELLRALADGKQIERRGDGREGWSECDAVAALAYITAGHTPALRVKPEFIRFECTVPRPVSSALDTGTVYFTPDLGHKGCASRGVWRGSDADRRALARGLVHLTGAAAVTHAQALLRGTALPQRLNLKS